MSEMIERVAAAINEKMRELVPSIPAWEEFSEENRQAIYPIACAAMAAMEQPSPKMMDAAFEVGIDMPAEEYWRAMITAELKPD